MKRMILTCITVYILLFSLSAHSQHRISGVAMTTTQEPLPFANVLLFQAADTLFVKGGITDEQGRFDIRHQASSRLFLKVQSVGYQEYISETFESAPYLDLEPLVVEEATEELAEVMVQATRPAFEHKIDRTVVNVQNSITNVGNNALNVLSKSPSVVVDRATEQITLMGNQGVVVMIDNKPVRMEVADVMDMLQGMSADNIDNIEIITTPPASYDVEGNAGIININTVKKSGEGFTGRVTARAGYGWLPKYGANLNLSYSKKRVYLYGNFSTDHDNTKEYREDFNNLNYAGVNVISDVDMLRKPYTGMHTGEVGIDYDLSPETIVGLSLKGQYRNWQMDSRTDTRLKRNGVDSVVQVVDSYEENRLFQFLGNAHVRHSFSDRSRVTVDYDHISFNRDNPSVYATHNREPEGTMTDRNFISQSETPLDIHVGKSDFSHQFSDVFSLETGVKATLSSFENRVRVAFEENGQLEDDDRFTDNFYMQEEIYAAYTSADWQLVPDLNVKAGVRYEFYDLQLESENEGVIVSRQRGNFFPTAYLNYKLAEESYVTVSFARRIDRPGFLILAPAFYFFDQNSLFTGNPGILPTQSTQYKVDYQLKGLSLSLQYMDNELPIYDFQPDLDEELQLFIIKPLQGVSEKTASFSASLPWEIADRWMSRYNFNAFHSRQQPVIEGNVIDQTTRYLVMNTTHNFDLGRAFELELSGIYNSPLRYATLEVDTRASLDVGLRKKFTSGAALSINVNDVLNTFSAWDLQSDIPESGIFYTQIVDLEGPVFRLSFSMPLGNRQVKARDRHSTGSIEEQQRLN